jgi:hypothetical protein
VQIHSSSASGASSIPPFLLSHPPNH